MLPVSRSAPPPGSGSLALRERSAAARGPLIKLDYHSPAAPHSSPHLASLRPLPLLSSTAACHLPPQPRVNPISVNSRSAAHARALMTSCSALQFARWPPLARARGDARCFGGLALRECAAAAANAHKARLPKSRRPPLVVPPRRSYPLSYLSLIAFLLHHFIYSVN